MTAVAAPSKIDIPPDEVPAEELDRRTTPKEHQHFWYTVLGLGLGASAYLVAWGLHGNSSSTYRVDNQWGAMAGLFILALAIERALEPFSRKLGPDTAKARARANRDQDEIEACRRLTAIVAWGSATGLAFLLCTKLNITLMQAVRADGSGQPPFWADLLVTGLVVGAGTKPLHDLVSNIESTKNSKKDSTDLG